MPDGIVVADVLGTVSSMNSTAEFLLGRTESQSIGRSIEDVLDPSCSPPECIGARALCGAGSLVAALLSAKSGILHLPPKSSSNLTCVTLSSIVDSAKGVIGIVVVLR